jgi:ABC-type cobalt transport system substrate-binding protein
MSKLPDSNKGTGDKQGFSSTGDRPPSTPRWVKVCGIIAIVLVLLFIIKIFISGGEHGPGRHMQGGEPIKQEEPREQAQTSGGYEPPGGSH